MKGVLVAVEDPARWDAILPVLPWLEKAGVQVRALHAGLRPPAREVVQLAESLGHPTPKLGWQRRVGRRPDWLVVGTCDDLSLLRQIAPDRPYLALPRVPLPTVLLGPRVQNRLKRAAEASTKSPAGELFDLAADGALAALLGGDALSDLSYIVTGLPQLDDPRGPVSRSIVVLHDWDLTAKQPDQRQALLEQARALESIMVMLIPAGVEVEVRSTRGQLSEREAGILKQVVDWIAERRNFPQGRVSVERETAWGTLAKARGVIALAPRTLAYCLVAGVDRAWWIPYALDAETEPPKQPQVASCLIRSKEELSRWAANRGWEEPPDGAHEIQQRLHSCLDGHAGERVAQTILAGLEE